MKKMTFKTICEKLTANETVKISTILGWNICKSEEIKIDSKKKMFSIPAYSKYCGACSIKMNCKDILSIEKAA
jgi:hypothetical protein